MAAKNRHRRKTGARYGLGTGWALFSILMVAVILGMSFYAWKGLSTGDMTASAQPDARPGTAPEAPAETDIPAAIETPVATETPVAAKTPAAIATPAATETPVTAKTPAAIETPAAVKGPANTKTPVAIETPAAIETTKAAKPTSAAPASEWPSRQFPGIPPFPGALDAVRLDGGRAEILLPAGGDSGFKDYASRLVRAGASVCVDNGRLTVLVMNDVEIQLIRGADRPSVALCGENAIFLEDEGHALPQSGRLAAQNQGGDGLNLTYRCVTLSGLMDYLDQLARAGWTSSDLTSPVDGTLLATYRLDEKTITIDYYASSSDFRITLDAKAVQ